MVVVLTVGGTMKTRINQELCIGCELCTSLFPSIYAMEGDKAVATVHEIPVELDDEVLEAQEDCPVGAIFLEE